MGRIQNLFYVLYIAYKTSYTKTQKCNTQSVWCIYFLVSSSAPCFNCSLTRICFHPALSKVFFLAEYCVCFSKGVLFTEDTYNFILHSPKYSPKNFSFKGQQQNFVEFGKHPCVQSIPWYFNLSFEVFARSEVALVCCQYPSLSCFRKYILRVC